MAVFPSDHTSETCSFAVKTPFRNMSTVNVFSDFLLSESIPLTLLNNVVSVRAMAKSLANKQLVKQS